MTLRHREQKWRTTSEKWLRYRSAEKVRKREEVGHITYMYIVYAF